MNNLITFLNKDDGNYITIISYIMMVITNNQYFVFTMCQVLF